MDHDDTKACNPYTPPMSNPNLVIYVANKRCRLDRVQTYVWRASRALRTVSFNSPIIVGHVGTVVR